jgi:hypothetical protein
MNSRKLIGAEDAEDLRERVLVELRHLALALSSAFDAIV